jgi:hypothetical protein
LLVTGDREVSKPRNLRAATLMARADTPKKRESLLHAKLRILKKMHKEGLISEEETSEEYVALDCIVRMIKDPTTPPALKLIAAKELAPFEAMTLAEQARLNALAEGGAPIQISIIVPNWAAGPQKQQQPALPPPDEGVFDV